MTVILGIQEAHDSSAALMIDGKIIAACQEERFSGLKGDYGYPAKSIDYCLNFAGIDTKDIDHVALASHHWNPVLTKIKRNANFSVDDWITEQHQFWKPKIFNSTDVSYYDIYKNRKDFAFDTTYQMDHLLTGYMDSSEMQQMKKVRKDTVHKKLGVPLDNINMILHEDCHTFYSYFAYTVNNQKLIAITSEGYGDYSNGTVSIISNEGRFEISKSSDNHLAHIYQYITLLLGMKPAQHEYKVMGLAPYANKKEIEKSYRVFENILKVHDLNVVFDNKPDDLYFHFRNALEGHRFDGIAGALQLFLEHILSKLILACIHKIKLDSVCFSGGVAQNIKACKTISEIPELKKIYVPPAAGDTSLSIGACFYKMWSYVNEKKLSKNLIHYFDNIYLGPDISDQETVEAMMDYKIHETFRVLTNIQDDDIAKMLTQGKVIARCCGRMEFGLRALGNRSILADPRNYAVVRKINDAIKFRDFWMPFTPTILSERADDYINNPKQIYSPYMTMAFESTSLARKELIAALHPADFTVRPQILEKKANPQYYNIIKCFEKMTGVGGILNTSFNLHGDPIVLTPKDALRTFIASDLDGLILGNYAILR